MPRTESGRSTAGHRAIERKALMVTVEVDGGRVEARLVSGGIGCPCCVGGVLARWGYARSRPIVGEADRVRPRRARCRGCGVTHVLLPVSLLLRRAYPAMVVFSALIAKAQGAGFRRIAEGLGVPDSTVRGWLRAMAARLDPVRVWFLGTAFLVGVDVRVPDTAGSGWGDALAAIAVATAAITKRFGAMGLLGTVTAAGVAVAGSGGRLLSPGWPGLPAATLATPIDPGVGDMVPRLSRG